MNTRVRIITKQIVRVVCFISQILVLPVTSDLAASPLPTELRIDYADYNQLSLVLKKLGWLEKEFETDKVPVRWVFSGGSNLALKNLHDNRVDFGSSSGLSAVWSKANGNPLRTVYMFSRSEWAMLLVPRDSRINSVPDLKGEKIAATPGTDPFFFFCGRCMKRVYRRAMWTLFPCSTLRGVLHSTASRLMFGQVATPIALQAS